MIGLVLENFSAKLNMCSLIVLKVLWTSLGRLLSGIYHF